MFDAYGFRCGCVFEAVQPQPCRSSSLDAEVFEPALIEKTEFAVRVRTVQKRRSSINDAPQQIFGRTC